MTGQILNGRGASSRQATTRAASRTTNNTHSHFRRLCRVLIPRRATVILVALAWSCLAFGGEIHDAAKSGDLEKAKVLLKGNPNLVFSNDAKFGATPLVWAAGFGYKDLADFLLANHAEVNAKDKYGWTPLYGAALAGHKEVVELLLASKAEADAKDRIGLTPLHMAAKHGHKEVAEILLAHGADVNARSCLSVTPLHLAEGNGHKDMVELLRQHGGHE